MLHPAVVTGAHLPSNRARVHGAYLNAALDQRGETERYLRGSSIMGTPEANEYNVADLGRRARPEYGPEVFTAGVAEDKAPLRVDEQPATAGQRVDEAYRWGKQYLNNPLEGKGRRRMGRQILDYPLGGVVRDGLEGQELFGHHVTSDQALMAERGLAGLTAVGIGVPAFLAAVNQLTTPQSAETIPL